ncbi:hypothetical protein Tcan_02379, partial [Toxocara canis]
CIFVGFLQNCFRLYWCMSKYSLTWKMEPILCCLVSSIGEVHSPNSIGGSLLRYRL